MKPFQDFPLALALYRYAYWPDLRKGLVKHSCVTSKYHASLRLIVWAPALPRQDWNLSVLYDMFHRNYRRKATYLVHLKD